MLVPPTAYQGGKQRIATVIARTLIASGSNKFNDLCCGSGAVSIALVNHGTKPSDITMLDASPWGLVWNLFGKGHFNLETFSQRLKDIPSDASLIQHHVKELSAQPADIDTPYVFLILQAASFGSKAIWIAGNQWRNCSFRSYWTPTETSNRRSHVNPMMPMPASLYERVCRLAEAMYGVNGLHCDIQDFAPSDSAVTYIDPPYSNTTAYGHSFDVEEYVRSTGCKCYVSEGRAIGDNAVLLSSGRKKGGISGNRTTSANQEWLSLVG